MIVKKEKKPEERTCFVCNERKAVFEPDGEGGEKHNFVPHIINGEQETVCLLPCKMLLLARKKH